jgi:hypothetical protein
MDTETTAFWRRCSNCKTPIALGARYWMCSVSTCQRVRAPLQYCKEACWEVHNEIENHRDGWCLEKRAPLVPDEENMSVPPRSASERSPEKSVVDDRPTDARRVVRDVPRGAAVQSESARPDDGSAGSLAPVDREQREEVLVVVSRLKGYVRTRSSGMNTSDDVLPILSDHMRKLCDDAIGNARRAGRKTVMARDFPRP